MHCILFFFTDSWIVTWGGCKMCRDNAYLWRGEKCQLYMDIYS